MAGWIEPNLGQPAMPGPMLTIFQTLKVRPHFVRPPTGILRQIGNVFPIRIVRIDQYLGVVGCTSSEGPGSWIQHAILLLTVLRIQPLLAVIGVMTNIEVPLHGAVFGGKRVERRNIVVSRQAVRIRLDSIAALEFSRISPRFEQYDGSSCLSQTRCYGTAPSS